jgi:hypothetical protein
MLDRLEFLLLSVLLVLLLSPVLSAASVQEATVEAKCQSVGSSGVVESPESVELNGEEVDQIECSRIGEYSFPEASNNTTTSRYFPHGIVLPILMPFTVLVFLGGFTARRIGLGVRRTLLYCISAPIILLAEAIALLGLEIVGASFVLYSVAVLIGLISAPFYILLSEDPRSRFDQSRAAVSFFFVGAINWLVFSFFFFSQTLTGF